MEIKEDNSGWSIRFNKGTVQLIYIDFRLGFLFSDASGEAKLFIGARCRLIGSDGAAILTPGDTPSVAPALALFNAGVLVVEIDGSGGLQIGFEDGRVLEVRPDPNYEAWELGSSSGHRLVCSPGGEVVVFEDNK